MSFASEVKEEVIGLPLNQEEQRTELSALLKLLSTISFTSNGLIMTIQSKNAKLIKMISQNLTALYGVKPVLQAIKDNRFNKTSTYALVVEEQVREILNDLYLWSDEGLLEYPPMKFFTTDNTMRAYLAGTFLASGSVNDPASSEYHLEMSTNEEGHARFLIRLMNKFYVNGKITTRRNKYIVYIKSGEQIADFLRVIGASQALMNFEDIRIQRDYVNNVLRLNNCEAANDVKSLKTATQQYEAVKFLVDNNQLDKLSKKDQEMAMLRYENPDVGLLELAQLYEAATGTALSKSGVRHRFNKIMDLAQKQMKGEG